MNRRALLESWKPAAGALATLVMAPTLLYWWRSARGARAAPETWADLGPASRIEAGGWQRRSVVLRQRDLWRVRSVEESLYVRRRGEEFEVLSPVCTHTGCLVRPKDDGFSCPCHRSFFDADGRSREGPAPRPLDRLAWKLEKGRLRVRWQRYRPGLARAEPA